MTYSIEKADTRYIRGKAFNIDSVASTYLPNTLLCEVETMANHEHGIAVRKLLATIGPVTCWMLVSLCGDVTAGDGAPPSWTTAAPRDEIRPTFAYDATGGRDGKGVFHHRTRRPGGAGWLLDQDIPGPRWNVVSLRGVSPRVGCRFTAAHATVRLIWQDDKGRLGRE